MNSLRINPMGNTIRKKMMPIINGPVAKFNNVFLLIDFVPLNALIMHYRSTVPQTGFLARHRAEITQRRVKSAVVIEQQSANNFVHHLTPVSNRMPYSRPTFNNIQGYRLSI